MLELGCREFRLNYAIFGFYKLEVIADLKFCELLQQWIQQTHPFWNRTGGKDHIFLAASDEGSCIVPEALRYMVLDLLHH